MKVYVLHEKYYEGKEIGIIGIYSTKELACNELRNQIESDSWFKKDDNIQVIIEDDYAIATDIRYDTYHEIQVTEVELDKECWIEL